MFSKSFSVAVMVSDAKKSAKWYKSKLGFNASGATWKLHLCEGKLEPGNTGIAFYVEDLEKAVASLKKKDVNFSKDYTKAEWGEFASFDDPDGNVFAYLKGSP
jgi:catechol 2,3-dioxygenase-like lactoylglutathione lyase family enzyme